MSKTNTKTEGYQSLMSEIYFSYMDINFHWLDVVKQDAEFKRQQDEETKLAQERDLKREQELAPRAEFVNLAKKLI